MATLVRFSPKLRLAFRYSLSTLEYSRSQFIVSDAGAGPASRTARLATTRPAAALDFSAFLLRMNPEKPAPASQFLPVGNEPTQVYYGGYARTPAVHADGAANVYGRAQSLEHWRMLTRQRLQQLPSYAMQAPSRMARATLSAPNALVASEGTREQAVIASTNCSALRISVGGYFTWPKYCTDGGGVRGREDREQEHGGRRGRVERDLEPRAGRPRDPGDDVSRARETHRKQLGCLLRAARLLARASHQLRRVHIERAASASAAA
ncbi:hypothetical protein B0H19DRAFT_1069764 [Mycena capillaripes]|nr:hypothetical protein B0H19DRAFT_1069764 [Mycena capillaripes]